MTLSSKETSAMTFYELDRPRGPVFSGFLARIGTGFGKAMRGVQYARMMHAMSELSDENLKAIGLARADIPRRAHEAVYGSDA